MTKFATDSRRTGDRRSLVRLAEFRFALREFLHFSESACERNGISAQQYQLLQVVGSGSEAGVASVTEIARRMILRHHSAVELVDRAQRSGLVERTTDAADHRRSMVGLTARGEEIVFVIAAEHLRALSEAGPKIVEGCRRAMEGALAEEPSTAKPQVAGERGPW